MINKKIFFPLFFFIAFVTGCDQKTAVREYTEVVIQEQVPSKFVHPPIGNQMQGQGMGAVADPAMQQSLQNSVASIPLHWQTPSSWVEEPGSGMRLVTFRTAGDFTIMCTITSLVGQAGGLKPNAVRWVGQLNMPMIDDARIERFLAAVPNIETATGQDAAILDFTLLQNDQNEDWPSMIAAVIQTSDTTIFVKMTGTKKAVSLNKDNFIQLCQSLKLEK